METETRKGIYTGKKKGKGNRWEIYFSEQPDQDDRKYSAFDPLLNLESIKEGNEYEYQVVHVPTKDDPNKFHHNLARKGKDMEFVIDWTGEERKPEPKASGQAQAAQRTSQIYTPKETERDRYWRVKEERDAAREPVITRLSCLSSASNIMAALLQYKDGYEQVKKDGGAAVCTELIARQFEQFAVNKMPSEQKQSERNEPIEANP